jgi:drug/metabolite transporter (DMT)-like permease
LDSGAACVALAAFVISFVGLCTKLLGGALPAVQLTLLTSLLSWCPTTAALLHRRCSRGGRPGGGGGGGEGISASTAALVAARGILGFVSIMCFFMALQLMPLQAVTPLFFCSAVAALLLEALLHCKPISCGALVGCLLAVGGVALIGRQGCHLHGGAAGACAGAPQAQAMEAAACTRLGGAEPARLPALLLLQGLACGPQHLGTSAFGSSSNSSSGGSSSISSSGSGSGSGCGTASGPASGHRLGVALSLAGALVNACQFLVVSRIGGRVSSTALTWCYHTTLVALSALLLLALRQPFQPAAFDARTSALVAAMAAATWLGQLLLTRGLQLGSATRASAINTSQVLYSFVWDAALLHTPVTACGAAGAASIIAGVLAVCWQGLRDDRRGGGRAQEGVREGLLGQAPDSAGQQEPGRPLLPQQPAGADGGARLVLLDGSGVVGAVAVQDGSGGDMGGGDKRGVDVEELRRPLLGDSSD